MQILLGIYTWELLILRLKIYLKNMFTENKINQWIKHENKLTYTM